MGKSIATEEREFKYPDLAHICEVKTIKNIFLKTNNEEILKDIADPNNGLLLDPNTHRLWDRDDLILKLHNGKYIFYESNTKKVYSTIKKKYINEKRTNFINKRLKLKNVL